MNAIIDDQTQAHDHIAAEARQWMQSHPQIMRMVEDFALALANAGRGFSMKLVIERARWEWHFRRAEGEEFLFNNNYTAVIARVLADRHPQIAKALRFRHRRAV